MWRRPAIISTGVLTTEELDQDFSENTITVIKQGSDWEDLFCGMNKKVFIFIFISTFHIPIYIFEKELYWYY